MGMTGFFEAAPSAAASHRHAHLSFYAADGSVLSFVDQRRFGAWRCMKSPDWPADRGPDPVKEHSAFRLGVIAAVAARPELFDSKPICQVLHDQSIFNGIGNYLRAEILCRAGVPPFAPARKVLADLPEVAPLRDKADLLTLCRDVPKEVIEMNLSKYQGGSAAAATGTDSEHGRWEKWLRVYGHDDASWAVDKEGRRIWFRGAPGKLYAQCAQKGSLDGRAGGRSSSAARRSSKDYFAGTPAAARKKPAGASAKATAAASTKRAATAAFKKPSAVHHIRTIALKKPAGAVLKKR
mmetsp:Transcript_108026/g.304342  ORF Transcript_108026/g.304342 Transcript_108026/m.304342 type:complete len:295 (+) Transcript_108026:61-945(+)